MEKQNKKNAREASTTTVDFPTLEKRFPQRIGKLLDDIHNCRDCQRCYKRNDTWHCYVGNVDYEGKPIQFKHHRICCCIDFLARPPKERPVGD